MRRTLTISVLLLALSGCASNLVVVPVNGTPMIVPDGYGEQTYSISGATEFTRYFTESDCSKRSALVKEGACFPKGSIWCCGEITTKDWRPLTDYSGTMGMASYEGEFLNNNWHGKGILTYDNGDWIEADWQWWNRRKDGTGGTCYRADTGTFHELIPYQTSHIIHDHGAPVCAGDGLMGFGQYEGCYSSGYQRTLAMMCKGDNFTFNDLLKLPFKVAIGTVLVLDEVSNSPAGQAALANREAKNQRKREAEAYKKGRRDGIRKAARKKRNLCMVDSTYC